MHLLTPEEIEKTAVSEQWVKGVVQGAKASPERMADFGSRMIRRYENVHPRTAMGAKHELGFAATNKARQSPAGIHAGKRFEAGHAAADRLSPNNSSPMTTMDRLKNNPDNVAADAAKSGYKADPTAKPGMLERLKGMFKGGFSTNAYSGPMNPTFMKMESHLPTSKIPIAQASRAGVAGTGQGSEPTRGGFLMASRQEAPVIPLMKQGSIKDQFSHFKRGLGAAGEDLAEEAKLYSHGLFKSDKKGMRSGTAGYLAGKSIVPMAAFSAGGLYGHAAGKKEKKAEAEVFAEFADRPKKILNGDHLQYILDKERGDGVDRGKMKEKDSESADYGIWPYKPGDFKPAKLSSVNPRLLDALCRAFDRHMGKTAATPAEMLEQAQHVARTPNSLSGRGSSVREVALPKMLTTIGTIARAPVAAVDKGGKY
jgi:hypothetical protein